MIKISTSINTAQYHHQLAHSTGEILIFVCKRNSNWSLSQKQNEIVTLVFLAIFAVFLYTPKETAAFDG